jgi:hypothetical protein
MKQLEYMRVVNLTDVKKQSQVSDRLLLQQMERELKREIVRRKKAKEVEPDEDEAVSKSDQKKPDTIVPPPEEET